MARHEVVGRNLALDYRPIADLIPYARNARTHSPEQVAQIAASIREFGWTNPILVDGENGVIAGHGRLLAARKLGMATVPVIELAHLSAAQKRAYVIADNKLALNAGWDDETAGLELGDLRLAGLRPGADRLRRAARSTGLFATATAGLTDPDEVPEVPETPVTQPGDVWVMGRHRLICGDSTDRRRCGRAIAFDGVRAAPDGHRPALRRELRSRLAGECRPHRWLGHCARARC